MKYESELIKEIVDTRGHKKSPIHYQSECVENWINEAKGAYPKLCDYESEWLNYINEKPIGDFPYESFTGTEGTIENVVPYEYKSAILKGNTKYRDIDTGDILDTFDETKNLELVSVKMPVLTTTGKNLATVSNVRLEGIRSNCGAHPENIIMKNIPVEEGKTYTISGVESKSDNMRYILFNRFEHRNPTNSNNHSQLLDEIGKDSNNKTFTIPKGIKYVSFTFGNCMYNNNGEDGWLQWDSIQLEEGSTATTYEPFKSNILTVNEEVELRKVGGVQDELNLLTGELTQRIDEFVLDGSENWAISNYTRPNHLRLYMERKKVEPYRNVINSRFADIGDVQNRDVEGIYITNTIDIQVDHSRLSEVSLDGFKNWLRENNIKVQAILSQESIKTVDLTVIDQDGNTLSRIKPIEGTMNIATDGTPIKPTFECEVPVEAITQNLTSFIEE